MAGYSIRTLAELSARARGYFTQSITGAVASVWANTFTVVGKVIALLEFEHEQRRKWLFAQMFASTADDLWLERHAFELGLTRTAATVAIGTVTIAATPGTVVPADLVFTRPDGLTVTTVAGATAAGNSVSLPVEAELASAAGNTDAGTTLTIDASSTVAGLGTVATVDAPGLTGGTDREALEALRARVLARKRQPPQGGSAGDYQLWAGEALATVRDVFVDRFLPNAGRVWVTFTVTDRPNGIPTAGQVTTVKSYLEDPIRRPVTAEVFVMAPIASAVPITISDLVPDTPEIRAAITAELTAVFLDRAEPGTPSGPFTLSRSWLNEAISRATGEDAHELVAPAADLTFASGYLPVRGTITYV